MSQHNKHLNKAFLICNNMPYPRHRDHDITVTYSNSVPFYSSQMYDNRPCPLQTLLRKFWCHCPLANPAEEMIISLSLASVNLKKNTEKAWDAGRKICILNCKSCFCKMFYFLKHENGTFRPIYEASIIKTHVQHILDQKSFSTYFAVCNFFRFCINLTWMVLKTRSSNKPILNARIFKICM